MHRLTVIFVCAVTNSPERGGGGGSVPNLILMSGNLSPRGGRYERPSGRTYFRIFRFCGHRARVRARRTANHGTLLFQAFPHFPHLKGIPLLLVFRASSRGTLLEGSTVLRGG